MGWSEILAFVFVAVLLVTSPGPNGVLIARTVPTSGRAAGFATIAGFFTAFYIHGTLSVLGISVILLHSATAFAIVKYLGAAYLCWVGIAALISAQKGFDPAPVPTPERQQRTLRRAYLAGLLTNGFNPKVSLFYLAIFPQFIPASDHAVTQAFLLVFLHSAINAIWFGAMVLLLSRLAAVARRERFQRWLKRITGIVFLGFGIKLAAYRPAL